MDSAFNQVCGLNFTLNKGRTLENAVFVELKRNGKEIYYYADKFECDFVVRNSAKVSEAIQVCYAMDDANKEREINGLVEAMDAFKLKEGLILTFEQTDELTVKGKKIRIVPVARWMGE